MSTTKDLLKTDRQKIRDHWKKSEAQLHLEINMIKQWLKTQKHLPEMPNDNTIEFFLTNCKFSIEKTKKVLDMHYSIRNLIPDFYENKHPSLEHMKDVFHLSYVCTMPNLTENLHRITVLKYKDGGTENFFPENFAAYIFRNIFEIRTHEDLTLGEIFIVDFEFLKMGHVVKTTPMLVKRAAFLLENVWANRLKELHLINSPSYVDTILILARTFLSKKLKERIYVHENVEDLFKFVPQELLPSDYGGDAMSMDEISDLWKLKIDEYRPRFDKMEELKVNEKLRPEKLENSDILGYQGSFKRIEVD